MSYFFLSATNNRFFTAYFIHALTSIRRTYEPRATKHEHAILISSKHLRGYEAASFRQSASLFTLYRDAQAIFSLLPFSRSTFGCGQSKSQTHTFHKVSDATGECDGTVIVAGSPIVVFEATRTLSSSTDHDLLGASRRQKMKQMSADQVGCANFLHILLARPPDFEVNCLESAGQRLQPVSFGPRLRRLVTECQIDSGSVRMSTVAIS